MPVSVVWYVTQWVVDWYGTRLLASKLVGHYVATRWMLLFILETGMATEEVSQEMPNADTLAQKADEEKKLMQVPHHQ